MNDSPRQRRRMIWLWPLIVIASLALLLFLGAASQVEDWRRDWTQNAAASADDAADESLRPVRSDLPPAEVAQVLQALGAGLPGWRLEHSERLPEGIHALHFTRSTRVWRFVDDVRVQVIPADAGSVVHAQSQSRVGRGDLGQNPRNLRELLGALRTRLAGD